MARTTFTFEHDRASDLKTKATDAAPLTLQKMAQFLNGLAGHVYSGTSFAVGQDGASGTVTISSVSGAAATGSVALSGVGGALSSGTVTLGGGAGDVTVVINGESIGPIFFNSDDNGTAEDLAAAITLEEDFGGFLCQASVVGAVVTITASVKGTAGNVTLTASRSAGTATASGATLAGGAQGSVGVTVASTLVTTDTTNLSDSAAATAVVAALDANSTVFALVDASTLGSTVEIVAQAKGVAGNSITISATSATGTATASDTTLTLGEDNEVDVTVSGTQVATDTTNLSDAAAATLVVSGLNADTAIAALVSASASGDVVTITALTSGPGGNAISLASSTTNSGTATASGSSLSGGASDSYNL